MATIKKLAQEKGWDYQKNVMYGKEGNYLITARQIIDLLNSQNNCKMVYIPLTSITQEQEMLVLEFLKGNKKDLKISAFEIVNQILVIRLTETLKGYSVVQFNHLTKTLVTFLREHEIAIYTRCVYCQETNVNSIMKIDKIAFSAHSNCIHKAQTDLEQQHELNQSVNKHYVSGLFGAIVGAIIGAIPWMLLEILWGFAAILSLLIGYAAFYGYKKMGGVVTKLTKWLMVIPLVVAVIVSNLVNITVFFVVEGYAVVLDNYIIAYTDPELSTSLIQSLLLGLLFALLGFISVFRKVKSEEFNTVIE